MHRLRQAGAHSRSLEGPGLGYLGRISAGGNEDAGADFPGVGNSSELRGNAEKALDKGNTRRLESSIDALQRLGLNKYFCSL